jgi:hypothetical protein
LWKDEKVQGDKKKLGKYEGSTVIFSGKKFNGNTGKHGSQGGRISANVIEGRL